MRTVLVFDKSITGHNLEYIHHLYVGASEKKEIKYIFAVPPEFNDYKAKLVWPEVDNVDMYYINPTFLKKRNLLFQLYYDVVLLRTLIRENGITDLIFINWLYFLTYCFLPKRISISGITYNIYLYNWKKDSFFTKIKHVLKCYLFVRLKNIKRIFILNDYVSTHYLNKLYHTNKFRNIVDPFNPINHTAKDLREKLNIPSEKKVFLLFGTLSERKGTLEVLNSIVNMNDQEKKEFHFILAGRVVANIKDEFYRIFNSHKDIIPVVLIDEFCTYEFIADLCFTCDCILVPYKQTSNSSGVLSYASFFEKPVIGPSSGLIGKLIRRHKLGTRLNLISSKSLLKSYHIPFTVSETLKRYSKDNSLNLFTRAILN